jgi:hypothetical protein
MTSKPQLSRTGVEQGFEAWHESGMARIQPDFPGFGEKHLTFK